MLFFKFYITDTFFSTLGSQWAISNLLGEGYVRVHVHADFPGVGMYIGEIYSSSYQIHVLFQRSVFLQQNKVRLCRYIAVIACTVSTLGKKVIGFRIYAIWNKSISIFLSAFAKSQKVTISFVISVCPSVRLSVCKTILLSVHIFELIHGIVQIYHKLITKFWHKVYF